MMNFLVSLQTKNSIQIIKLAHKWNHKTMFWNDSKSAIASDGSDFLVPRISQKMSVNKKAFLKRLVTLASTKPFLQDASVTQVKGTRPVTSIQWIFQDPSDVLLESQRKKHAELIHQLKDQLQELESYAYEAGDGTVPSNMLLERQRVVMGT